MPVTITDYLIPVENGQAVSAGWPGGEPLGVTWHWTAGPTIASCRQALGGANPDRKGIASAHFCVGRSLAEGVDRYVTLENRSWHAGKNQTVRWDGKPLTKDAEKASRTTVGIETVNLGYAREGFPAKSDWITVARPDGRSVMQVQPWSDEQIGMMIEVGREVVRRWPSITERAHHGHHDICPGYKDDVAGFPFAQVLSGIYGRPIPDVWTPFRTVTGRQKALNLLTYPVEVDGAWGAQSDKALRQFQADLKLAANGMWNSFVCWRVYDLFQVRGMDFEHLLV